MPSFTWGSRGRIWRKSFNAVGAETSAWIFHCLWNRWQRALPLCGSSLKKLLTNSPRPPRGTQIGEGIYSWSSNSQVRWLVSSSSCFLGEGESTDLSKKPRPPLPQLLLLLWENTKAELDGKFNSTSTSKVCPGGSGLDSQKVVLRGPLSTSGVKSRGPGPLGFLLQAVGPLKDKCRC